MFLYILITFSPLSQLLSNSPHPPNFLFFLSQLKTNIQTISKQNTKDVYKTNIMKHNETKSPPQHTRAYQKTTAWNAFSVAQLFLAVGPALEYGCRIGCRIYPVMIQGGKLILPFPASTSCKELLG